MRKVLHNKRPFIMLYTVRESGTVTTPTCLHKAIQMLHVNIIIIVQLVVILLVLSWANSWLRSYNLSLEGVIQSADMMPALMGSSITSRNTDQNCDHVIANNQDLILNSQFLLVQLYIRSSCHELVLLYDDMCIHTCSLSFVLFCIVEYQGSDGC